MAECGAEIEDEFERVSVSYRSLSASANGGWSMQGEIGERRGLHR